MILVRFLNRNLKGLRTLVLIAILITVVQVGCDLLAAMPLKFIPSKVNNPGSDPACTFPFLDGFLSLFDQPYFDPSLTPGQPGQITIPPISPCPATGNPNLVAHPVYYHHSVIGVIIFSLLMLIVFGSLSALLTHFELYLAAYIAQNLGARLRTRLFEHTQRLTLEWHDTQKTGDLVQRITGNIADIEKLVTDGLVDLLAGSLTLIGVAIIMGFISPQYTLLSLCIGPILFLIVIVYTRAIRHATRRQAKAAGEVAMVATEDINALAVIRAFTLEKREDQRFKRYVSKQKTAGLRAGRLQAQFTPLVAVLVVFGTAIIVGTGGYVAAGNPFNGGFFTIAGGSLDIGTLVLFLTYLKMLYQPMRDLSKLTNLASSAGSGAERIQEVLDQVPEVNDTVKPYSGPKKLRGEISFENVFFSYTEGVPVIHNFKLHIPAGKRIALVGLSGGGKTTLVKLIPRFYTVDEGSVKIDGNDNCEYPLTLLRQNISMVLQESVLFEGTFRDNIEVGRPGARLDEIIAAAKKAQIHETIMERGGYEAEVLEQGKNLSLGQRQRIAIARAILRDAPILILDEPTASLDVEAEGEVMRALDQLMSGRTVIMISHRLSTLGHVDEIVVVKGGQIAEQGTYLDLKRQGGIFTMLLEEQNRYNVERMGEQAVFETATASRSSQPRIPVTPAPDIGIIQSWPELPVSEPEPVLATGSNGSNGTNGDNGSNGSNGSNGNNSHEDDDATRRYERPVTFGNSLEESDATQRFARPIKFDLDEEEDTLEPTEKRSVVKLASNGNTSNGRSGAGSTVEEDAAPATSARLILKINSKTISQRVLDKPVLTIGRHGKSDIRILNKNIANRHAEIHQEHGNWVLEDVDSFNGFIFRGRRIDRHVFNDGDQIFIAPAVVLQYRVTK